MPTIVPSVFTDSSGYYQIYAPPGTYHLDVWPPFDSNYIYYDQPAFSVGTSDITQNITLATGIKLSGYLTDPSGAPIHGALASLNQFYCGWFSNYTGYYFVTAPPGTYTLTIQPKTGPTFTTYYEYNLNLTQDTIQNFTLNTQTTTPQPTTNPTPTPSGPAPAISSVSPITTTRLQTITISGTGFGNMQPQLKPLTDGSVDCVGGSNTPVIKIYDLGTPDIWEAGVEDFPNSPSDSIGIILESWTDTTIVLGGFGSAINTTPPGQSWKLSPGDPLLIEVVNTNGQATYPTTVVSNQSNQNSPQPTPSTTPNPTPTPGPIPTPTPSLPTPDLTVSCNSFTSSSNLTLEINGSLTADGTTLSGAPILISYSVTGGTSWQALTQEYTAPDGSFLAEWLPTATGSYVINATYPGNSAYSSTSTAVSLTVMPFLTQSAQDVFSVVTNSSLSDLEFNSTSRELTFTVTGPSSTTGYVNAYIAKPLITDITTLKVVLDGNQLNYTAISQPNSYLIYITYNNSTHNIVMNLGLTPSKPNLEAPIIVISIGSITAINASVYISLILKRRKKQKTITT